MNTSIFCDQPSKNGVSYRGVFCFALKNGDICSVLCISSLKSIDIYSICCVFALLPQKKLNRKNAVIYSILSISKSGKSSQKCVKTTLFSEFRYPQNRGGRGNALGDASERPGFRPKSFPSAEWRIGLESYWMRTCFRNIFVRFFGAYLLETDGFFGSKWVPESSCEGFFPKELLPISTCYCV